MSVSSHLSPEPERRLWIIYEKMRMDGARADLKLAGLAAFCLLELLLFAGARASSGLDFTAVILLVLILPFCLLGLSGYIEAVRNLPLLDRPGKPGGTDSLLTAHDLSRYPHIELVRTLDKYLGGGVSAMPYYEDIVGRILGAARTASRKERLLGVVWIAAAAAQLLILLSLLLRAA